MAKAQQIVAVENGEGDPDRRLKDFDNQASSLLTNYLSEKGILPDRGGMAEWFKAPVLKTGVRKDRGFESYSLRHLFFF